MLFLIFEKPYTVVIAQVQGGFLTRSFVKYRTEGWFKKLWEEERILVVEGEFFLILIL